MRARKRAYDFGSIFEALKAVHALSFNLEEHKTIFVSVYVSELFVWTDLVRVGERTDFCCITLDHCRLPRLQ